MILINNGQDEDRKIFEGNKVKGYLDKNDDLYGFKPDGFAYLVASQVHEIKAVSTLKRWLKTNG